MTHSNVSLHLGEGLDSKAAEPELGPVITQPLPRLTGDIPPYSFPAFSIALLCLVAAIGVQLVFRSLGASLLFATYYPAVVIAGLLAGAPAGVLVVFGSLLTVWWVFIPPAYEFFPVNFTHLMDLVLFMLSSACILVVVERYRAALTQIRKHEQERELVVKELEHRGRNTYAVIEAIVNKTLEDEPERASIISGRIRAVKYTNDLINQTSTHTVLLRTLLLHEFTPYGEDRLNCEGPDIELRADTARYLVLVFHELVTNAAKYGALSNAEGRVLISWKKAGGNIDLEWREEGGPKISPPKRHNFGSRIVTQSLRSVLGSITPEFASDGLRCAITFRA